MFLDPLSSFTAETAVNLTLEVKIYRKYIVTKLKSFVLKQSTNYVPLKYLEHWIGTTIQFLVTLEMCGKK